MSTDSAETDERTDTENSSEWAPDEVRSRVPNTLKGKGTRALVCAIRNPDASPVQVAEKCGLDSPFTVTNAVRTALQAQARRGSPHEGSSQEVYDKRGTHREAEEYHELTEKQRAIIDFAAEHPQFLEENPYCDVADAIHEEEDVLVNETYVGATMRKYEDILAQQRALVAGEEESPYSLGEATSDLTIREVLAAAGYALPPENLDAMPDVEGDGSEQATLGEAEAGAAEFDPATQVQEEEVDEAEMWLTPEWCDAHSHLPGAEEAVRLPDDAGDGDVQAGQPYWAYVNSHRAYGVFACLNLPAYGDDVSGLVGDEYLVGHPSEYEKGDAIVVELVERRPQGMMMQQYLHAHPEAAEEEREEEQGEGEGASQAEASTAGDAAQERAQATGAEAEGQAPLETQALLGTLEALDEEMQEMAERHEERHEMLAGRIDGLDEEFAAIQDVQEFADRVDESLAELREGQAALEEDVYETLENSVGREVVEQAEAAEQRVDTLREAVDSLAEQVDAATSHTGSLGRVLADVQRLQAQGAAVREYEYRQAEGHVTLTLDVDLPEDTAQGPDLLDVLGKVDVALPEEQEAADE